MREPKLSDREGLREQLQVALRVLLRPPDAVHAPKQHRRVAGPIEVLAERGFNRRAFGDARRAAKGFEPLGDRGLDAGEEADAARCVRSSSQRKLAGPGGLGLCGGGGPGGGVGAAGRLVVGGLGGKKPSQASST